MATSPTRVLAYVREDARYAPVREAALATARAADAELILYDADAATKLGSPLPSWWSGEQEERPNGDRLTPEDLEAAGRHALANHVRTASAAGIEAFGWLPSGRGAQDFITYAEAQGADLLVVPEDLDDEGLFARFRGAPSPGEIAEKATMAVLTVPVTAAA